MKTFNTYISEKLKIDKHTVSNNSDSFDEFLDMLIKDDFKFIHDDDF